jgi:exosortase
MTNLSRKNTLIATVLLGGLLLWAYGSTLGEVAETWSSNPQYSHGYLVPAFALFLLWTRRKQLGDEPLQPSWWGLPLVLLGTLLHLAGARLYLDWIGAAAVLPMLAGLALTLGGIRALRWSWRAIAFLVFMLPLPYRVEVALAHPLQRLATVASTYVLQTVGFAAVAEGNVIIMEETRIGVIDACNGLGMLVTFFAVTTAVAMLLKRPLVDKIIIVLSALPIALLANIIRIAVTGILAELVGAWIVDLVFHDLAGWLMMPLALGILWLELQIFNRLVIEESAAPEEVLAFALAQGSEQQGAGNRGQGSGKKQEPGASPTSDSRTPTPAAAPTR